MKPVAFIYTCRNPGQVSLLWAHQPPPFGHGWVDVKRVGLVREDEVSEVVRNGEKCVDAYQTVKSSVIAHLQKRIDDYVDEHGSVDPETGTVEFPGNGEEYVGTLEEIIDEIRELLK